MPAPAPNIHQLIATITNLPIEPKDKDLCIQALQEDPSLDTVKSVLSYLYSIILETEAMAEHLQSEAAFYQSLHDSLNSSAKLTVS